MNLQNHYNLITEGKGNKIQFVKQARELFPQYFNQYTTYDNTVSVLKSKQIISETAGGVVSKGFDIWDWKKILAEETKSVEKTTSKEVLDYRKNAYDNADIKNADNINFNEIMKGFYCEMKDPKNADKTGDELKAMVVKNLAKDPLYYTKNGEFGTTGVGYTTEAPGLGTNTQPKSKNATVLGGNDEVDSESEIVKNSLVGSTKKNVQDTLSDSEAKTSMPSKVKEMPVTPQNSSGVKKMPMPGKEKKIKLKEGIGMFHDPIGYEKSELSDLDKIFTKKYKGNDIYVIYKNGKEVKTIEGEGNANAWINNEKRKLSEQAIRSLIRNIIKEELEEPYKKFGLDQIERSLKDPNFKKAGMEHLDKAIEHAEAPEVRYAYKDLDDEELQQYINALKQLKAKYNEELNEGSIPSKAETIADKVIKWYENHPNPKMKELLNSVERNIENMLSKTTGKNAISVEEFEKMIKSKYGKPFEDPNYSVFKKATNK